MPKITLSLALLISTGNIFAQQAERETGIELYKKGDYSGAAKVLKKASKIHPADGSVRYYLGLSYTFTIY